MAETVFQLKLVLISSWKY